LAWRSPLPSDRHQLLELRQVAERAGWEVVETYVDHAISGIKGRDQRPAFDRLHNDAAARRFDLVMAWSVDRLGRSLQHCASTSTCTSSESTRPHHPAGRSSG
jgi:DNA invertase Pin-like site-specific DNA recombinase